MRRTVLTVLITLVFASSAAAEIAWSGDSYSAILERAEAEGRYVFIDFYTTWCGPCKQLEKKTYKDAEVIALLNGMISVKYDAEKGVGVDLARQYHVGFYPTLVLIGPDGKEIDRHLGYLDPEPFVETMTNYTKGIGTVADYRARVERDPQDRDAWKAIGTKGAYAGRIDEAVKGLTRYLELSPEISPDERAEVLFTLGEAHYEGKADAEAARVFEQVMEEFRGTDWEDQAATRLARTYHRLGNNERCVEVYLGFVKRNPDSPKAMNSFAWFCATRGVGLDEALPYAIEMVELTARDPGYLDTLAELYYARGEFDKAIEVGKEAADKSPDDPYFREQVDKFEKAKAEADGQARH